MSYVGRISNPSGSTMEKQRSPNYTMGKKEKSMPLLSGKKNIGHNIEVEKEAGNPHDQSVAIALNKARESGARIPKKANHESHKRHSEKR